ncbi:uncharacterized protein UV8b_04107 [Ustilaginoidea virens]|uniref:Uncharacterized protein n=1 Tax=Ustilaginoidea virens TaxID=1159556 RepID=A0A8E5MHN6_USTVR|nr:uncharacterized protein UV8b_04107 [Ustilaginoidea virens]QUC19866.1 hypothetical protein UV8b_04107 [Ustilaginoidea virens]
MNNYEALRSCRFLRTELPASKADKAKLQHRDLLKGKGRVDLFDDSGSHAAGLEAVLVKLAALNQGESADCLPTRQDTTILLSISRLVLLFGRLAVTFLILCGLSLPWLLALHPPPLRDRLGGTCEETTPRLRGCG